MKNKIMFMHHLLMAYLKHTLLLLVTLCAMMQPAFAEAFAVADDNATTIKAIPLEPTTLSPLETLQEFSGSLPSIDSNDDVLDPELAFILSSYFDAENQLFIRLNIADDYYIYRDKFKLTAAPDSGVTLGPLLLPKGKNKHDEFFGDMQVYYNNVAFPVTFSGVTKNQAPFNLTITYQGCAERGVCYPAISKQLSINLAEQIVAIQFDANNTWDGSTTKRLSAIATNATTENQSEQSQFADIISNKNIFYIVGAFFFAGLLLTFTPCVFPMVPILSGIIAGQGKSITTHKAFMLSLVYVLAMATTYAIAGAIVGRFGAEFNLQAWFQNPIILSSFAAIFVLLALSMFGFYELQIPPAMQQRLNAVSHSQKGGHLIGVAMMGFFSALIVGPCITAPLVGALLYIAHTQDMLIGGITLFALGLGMGTPLLIIGTSAGKFLPKVGSWMTAVKTFFGVGLLAVAIWLLERILPTAATMGLTAALLIVYGLHMRALDTLPSNSSGWQKLGKGLGLILLLWGAMLLLGAALGSKDFIHPLKGLSLTSGNANSNMATTELHFKPVKGIAGLNTELSLAAAANKNVMLDFYADWCTSCKEMEKHTFTDPAVQAALSHAIVLQTDVTPNDDLDKALMSAYGIFGPPAILFFDKEGKELRDQRVVGYMDKTSFAAHLQKFFN